MEYHPEDKERIPAKRAESELRHRTYYPTPTPNKPEWTGLSPLDLRLAKLRKIREEEALNGVNGGNTRRETESGRMMSLSEIDGKLFAHVYIPVEIRIDSDKQEAPNFAIVSENDEALSQFRLTEPAYFPEEEDCRYVVDMRGLSVLNRYVRNNFHRMIEEWNHLHPDNVLEKDIPFPNYNFLASSAYAKSKS